MFLLGLGYIGLFIGTFISSTLLPFPSEALLVGAFELDLNVTAVLIIATIGNFSGGLTNYWIGYKANNTYLKKKFNLNETKILKWHNRFNKWGYWLGFVSWLPFVGDPMVAVLGFFKVKLLPLSVTMFIGKFLRYLVITLIYLGWINVA